MYQVKKYRDGYRMYGNAILAKCRYAYFGKIRNKNVAIISWRPLEFRGTDTLRVLTEKKIPLHIVDMNMRMGKGFKTTETSHNQVTFLLEETYEKGRLYEIYELVN